MKKSVVVAAALIAVFVTTSAESCVPTVGPPYNRDTSTITPEPHYSANVPAPTESE